MELPHLLNHTNALFFEHFIGIKEVKGYGVENLQENHWSKMGKMLVDLAKLHSQGKDLNL